ncbi:hypothetical protein KR009_008392 [Drosophila setifemur]|nr:hypothetical protein KR009_008392 [Drosophila setifemur]
MPLLEMGIIFDNIYHGVQRCFGSENAVPAKQPASIPRRKRRSLRRRMLKDQRCSRLFRGSRFSISQECDRSLATSPELTCFFSRSYLRCSPSNMNLRSDESVSEELMKRQWLQKRPLLENARQVIEFKWANCRSYWWPSLISASVHISFGSSVINHSLLGMFDEEESQPPILVLVFGIAKVVQKIYKRADKAICSSGPGPIHITSSPAMGLIDIHELFQCLNNALIDYILSNCDSVVPMGQ